MPQIYLDHAATTPTASEIVNAMLPYYGGEYGNPSSIYSTGRHAKVAITTARHNIASLLGVIPDEIFFTGSGTESDNLAILGVARANREFGNHILISTIEHKAVLESAKQLEKEGFIIEYIPVDNYGMIDIADCVARINDKTILISVMYANNEIGTIQPITELAHAIALHKGKKQFPLMHTDACQAAGYLSLDVTKLGIDLMTLNSSKIYGPKGIGLLYKHKNVHIEPIIFGGGQEQGIRSGTENLPLIIGLAEALLRVEERREEESERLMQLRDYCINALRQEIPDMALNGHLTSRLPNNIHISVPYVEGESMVLMLDEAGIQASTGSACSASDLQVSHVLVAINQDISLMHGSLRLSLGEKTTQKECDYLLSVLPGIIKRLRSISPLTISL